MNRALERRKPQRTQRKTMDILLEQSADRSAADLVRALQAGEPRAFDEAYRRYHPAMLHIARRYARAAPAEDITQDAWLAAISSFPSFEGRSSLKTWLCRIVINKALNTYRKSRWETPSSPCLTQLADNVTEHHSMPTPVYLSEPEMAVHRSRVREQIRVGMKNMKKEYANALLLKGMSPLSGPQVSDVLAVSPENLRVMLHRARSQLTPLM